MQHSFFISAQVGDQAPVYQPIQVQFGNCDAEEDWVIKTKDGAQVRDSDYREMERPAGPYFFEVTDHYSIKHDFEYCVINYMKVDVLKNGVVLPSNPYVPESERHLEYG